MTVSIGLAQYKTKEEMKGFVDRVDQLMYQGKKNGKDKVCSGLYTPCIRHDRLGRRSRCRGTGLSSGPGPDQGADTQCPQTVHALAMQAINPAGRWYSLGPGLLLHLRFRRGIG